MGQCRPLHAYARVFGYLIRLRFQSFLVSLSFDSLVPPWSATDSSAWTLLLPRCLYHVHALIPTIFKVATHLQAGHPRLLSTHQFTNQVTIQYSFQLLFKGPFHGLSIVPNPSSKYLSQGNPAMASRMKARNVSIITPS